MHKKKTEFIQLIGHQCFFEYGDGDELNKGLREIAGYNLPDWLAKCDRTYAALVHAFLYGAMMGIRHERKKRKEKVNKSANVPVVTLRMMSDEEWKQKDN